MVNFTVRDRLKALKNQYNKGNIDEIKVFQVLNSLKIEEDERLLVIEELEIDEENIDVPLTEKEQFSKVIDNLIVDNLLLTQRLEEQNKVIDVLIKDSLGGN